MKDWMARVPWRRQKQPILLLGLWTGCVALYLFGYRAQWGEFVQVRASMTPLLEKREQYGALIEQYPGAELELAELKRRFQQVREGTLGREAIPRAIQQLAQLAAETAVTLESIGPREDLKAPPGRLPEGVGKRFIEVWLRCPYQALGDFLAKMEGLPTRFSVDRLILQGDQKELPGAVRVELLLGIYGLI